MFSDFFTQESFSCEFTSNLVLETRVVMQNILVSNLGEYSDKMSQVPHLKLSWEQHNCKEYFENL